MSKLLEDGFRSEINRVLRFTSLFDSVDDDFNYYNNMFIRGHSISRTASYIKRRQDLNIFVKIIIINYICKFII